MGLQEWRIRRKGLKLRWWGRMCRMAGERLVSLLFRRRHEELRGGGARFSGLRSMRDLLLECDLDDAWREQGVARDAPEWLKRSTQAVKDLAVANESREFAIRASLQSYAKLGHSHSYGMPRYLDDRSNLQGTRLLTKCRLGYLMLMQTVGKMLNWPLTGGTCVLCGAGAEDVEHFLVGCEVLESCRLRFRAEATSALLLAGAGAGDARAALHGPNDQQLRLVLGGLVAFPASGEPVDVAMAAWALDKATKNFLTACWRRRAHFVGHLSVRQGKLVQESALDARDPALAPATQAAAAAPARTADQLEACRPFWSAWIRKPDKLGANVKRNSRRSPFFVVLVGRRPGIYTTWLECSRNVSGVPGAKFKGFSTRAEALRAWTERAT